MEVKKFKGRGLVQITGKQTYNTSVLSWAKLWQHHMGSQPNLGLKLDEGKVFGARYYTVEPIGGNWIEMERWSVETFGPTSNDGVWTPGQRWYLNNQKFWFRTEKDRNWFVVKWSA